jgi:hypothetical protein
MLIQYPRGHFSIQLYDYQKIAKLYNLDWPFVIETILKKISLECTLSLTPNSAAKLSLTAKNIQYTLLGVESY